MKFVHLKTIYIATSYPYILLVTVEMLLMSKLVYPAMFEIYGPPSYELNIIFGIGISLGLTYLLCPYSTRGMYYTFRSVRKLDPVFLGVTRMTAIMDSFIVLPLALVWSWFIFQLNTGSDRIYCQLLVGGIILFARASVGHSTWNYSGKRW